MGLTFHALLVDEQAATRIGVLLIALQLIIARVLLVRVPAVAETPGRIPQQRRPHR
ncbi:hypothetical protein [Kitasatospora sp. NPDC050463]|uniref:hypothetical protein n=1 Tax=Kitasatospora sp. NPDC050463 TaxID=3155786 RepID=UPI0033DD2DD8